MILKREIERSPYLSSTDRKIPWDTWESIIKELEIANIILERPPKTENRVTRRTDFYLLTLREEVKEDVRN